MWKHKTKWLVRGGRKVKCYLCGKKILAKGDLFLFHGDTGYYSHQSCMTESTTISGNERRRAVKKIAVGAAVVGAIAAGAGKFLDVSSQSKNSPAAQTILTSQGLIPPALTSDPSNPVPGQMWYRSDAGVMAHFDAVQNRVVYSSEINNGMINVTSKGIINGLSVLPNDGTGGFGPDTTKDATAPEQYGGTYTETSGIQEAVNYANSIITTVNTTEAENNTYINTSYFTPTIELLSGYFPVSASIHLLGDSSKVLNWHIRGSGLQNSVIDFLGSGYGIICDTNSSGQYEFEQISPFTSNGSSDGWLYCDNAASGGNMVFRDINVYPAEWAAYGMYLTGLENVIFYDFINTSLAGNIYLNNSIVVFYGGQHISANVAIDVWGGDYVGIFAMYSGTGNGMRVHVHSNINYIDINGAVNLFITLYSDTEMIKLSNISYTGYTSAIQIVAASSSYTIQNTEVDGLVIPSTLPDSSLFTSDVTTSNIVVHRYIDNSGTFTMPVNTPTTPSVPTSATAQENTNPYAVDVYVYGGDVTKIQITRNGTAYTVFSVSTAIAMSGQAYKLNPGDSITVTYSTAPTWEWLSD